VVPGALGGFGGSGRFRQPQDPVAADPADQVDGQIAQDEREPGDVVAGVGDDQNVRVPGLPMPGRDQTAEHGAELLRGHRGDVVGGSEPGRVQQRGPRRPARLEGGDERVRPARDQLGLSLTAAIDVAEQPV
jgi:hypothetical protein